MASDRVVQTPYKHEALAGAFLGKIVGTEQATRLAAEEEQYKHEAPASAFFETIVGHALAGASYLYHRAAVASFVHANQS